MKRRILGIVGGGQLGRMLAEAARAFELDTIVLDPTPESPAGQIATQQIVGNFDNPADVKTLAEAADIITFEIESAHADALADIERERPDAVHPLPSTLSIIKDKYAQKVFLSERDIPVAPFRSIASLDEVREAAAEWGYPLVLKARHGAYDGRGNALVESEESIEEAFELLQGRDLYAEAFVPFERELAVMAARTRRGDITTYPVVETVHENHICHMVLAPAPVTKDIHEKAERLAHDVLAQLPGAGVFGIEMFLTREGEVLINEIAPRVHNSGHHTIEACETSQFAQQVRVVIGEDLGSTELIAPAAVMINILGDRTGPASPSGIADAEALGRVYVHIYGKRETKPSRKMGHITVLADTLPEAIRIAREARACVSI